ncbi:MAG: CPBP family intramembrane metalloprotease [Bacteroidales bacterium]|nr:CPBP family intramembrane metalloprotease [Candidatus Cacconaster merdequi]
MKKALIFAASVCAFSWAMSGVFYAVLGGDIESYRIAFRIFCTVYMFFPMITALLLQWRSKERLTSTGLLAFKPRWSWLVAMVLPLVLVALTVLFSALVPGAVLEYSPDQLINMSGLDEKSASIVRLQFEKTPLSVMIVSGIVNGIMAGCTINAVAAFGEEYGWRNYMVSALRGTKFCKAALVIGAVWGIWHAPIILMGHNYPQHPVAGIFLMAAFCILIGFIELYLVKKAGSVYPAAIFHGTINAVGGFVFYLVQGGSDLTTGVTGAAGFVAEAVVCLAIFLYDKHISRDNIITSEL